ncbi:hypothetical protein SpCBS45565_g07530 [Spizellomyces sp. 'palustris']|nr:hypothetical protein SpCBS45565_g07530 [Spizellomyces sp. 'palustris']
MICRSNTLPFRMWKLSFVLLLLYCFDVSAMFASRRVSPDASIADVFFYNYSVPIPGLSKTVTDVTCLLTIPKLSYKLTRLGKAYTDSKFGRAVVCTIMDAQEKSLTLAALDVKSPTGAPLLSKPVDVWYGSPVRATRICNGYGLQAMQGGIDDFSDISMAAPGVDNTKFCTDTANARKTYGAEGWTAINRYFKSSDTAVSSKTQARFLDCYGLCGSSPYVKRYRNKRCQGLALNFPIQFTASEVPINLYSGSVAPLSSAVDSTTAPWSIQQACGMDARTARLTANCLNVQQPYSVLSPFFQRTTTVGTDIVLNLFDSGDNPATIFDDLAGFYAMSATGVVNLYVDSTINRITPGTAFATSLDAIFLYNKQITDINVIMQSSGISSIDITRCDTFNAMLETYLPVASLKSCGTGRESLPAWNCKVVDTSTQQMITTSMFKPARLVTTNVVGSGNLYEIVDYSNITVTIGPRISTQYANPSSGYEYRFTEPCAPGESLIVNIPYTALLLQNASMSLARTIIKPSSQPPTLTVLPSITYKELVSDSAKDAGVLMGTVETTDQAMLIAFELNDRGFIGETNVKLQLPYSVVYGTGPKSVNASTTTEFTLTCGLLPKHNVQGIPEKADPLRITFHEIRNRSDTLKSMEFDVTTHTVQGLGAYPAPTKLGTMQFLAASSLFTIFQDLPPNSLPLPSSTLQQNSIRRHTLVYPSELTSAVNLQVTSLDSLISGLGLLQKVGDLRTKGVESQFRWFAEQMGSKIEKQSVSTIELPAVWTVKMDIGMLAIISVRWSLTTGITTDIHPTEFMLLVGVIEWIRLVYGCPVIVVGDFQDEFRWLASPTGFKAPGTAFGTSWLKNLFQYAFNGVELDLNVVGNLWPLRTTYTAQMIRSRTATRPASGNWFDHVWLPFSPIASKVKPQVVNRLNANMVVNGTMVDAATKELGNCSVSPQASCSREFSNHMPIVYNITWNTGSASSPSFSLVSLNMAFFDVTGSTRLDYLRPYKFGVDYETLSGNGFSGDLLWTKLTNRLKKYLANFDIVATQSESELVRVKAAKPFISGFEYSNKDANYKGVYIRKKDAKVQSGGTSTCAVINYSWDGSATVTTTVDADPDNVEEMMAAARDGASTPTNTNPTLLACGFWALSTPGTTSSSDRPFVLINVHDRPGYFALSRDGNLAIDSRSTTVLRQALYSICLSLKAQSGRGGLDCGVSDNVEQKISMFFVGDWNNQDFSRAIPKPNSTDWRTQMENTFKTRTLKFEAAIAKQMNLQCPLAKVFIPGDTTGRGSNNLNCDNFEQRVPYATTGKGRFYDFLFYCGPNTITILDSKIDSNLGYWGGNTCEASSLDPLQADNCASTDVSCELDAISDHRAVRIKIGDEMAGAEVEPVQPSIGDAGQSAQEGTSLSSHVESQTATPTENVSATGDSVTDISSVKQIPTEMPTGSQIETPTSASA